MDTKRLLKYSINTFSVILLASCLSCNGNKSSNADNSINAPDEVSNLQCVAGDSMITLSWTDPADTDISHISVTWTDGATSVTDTAEAGAESYTITDLTVDTEYGITLTVVDTSGNESEGSSFSMTPTDDEVEYRFIYTADDLNAVRGGISGYEGWDLSGSYILMANIDLAGYDAGDSKGWKPIGDNSSSDDTTCFTGFFDGNNHVIRNLSIERGDEDYQGLFGYVSDGIIRGLGLENVDVTGNDYTGGLVGANNGTVSNSYSTGSVTGNHNTGGLVGAKDGTVSNSYSTGSVTGQRCTGGLVGYSYDGPVENSYATGSVSGETDYTGGLVGNNGGTVENSYATGSVSGNDYTGGLVGANTDGSVENSYATGSVSGNDYTGGLVGRNWGRTVSNSYATGSVSGKTDNTGGLVGYNDGTVNNSYYDSETTGMRDTGKGEPRTTDQMKLVDQSVETYETWDFAGETDNGTDDIWSIDGSINDGYPYLTNLVPE